MNTSDTEWDSDKEVVGSDCLCVLGSEKHNPECEYAKPTPDTEWQKEFEKRIDQYWNEHDGTHFYKDELKELVNILLSSALASQLSVIEKVVEDWFTKAPQYRTKVDLLLTLQKEREVIKNI